MEKLKKNNFIIKNMDKKIATTFASGGTGTSTFSSLWQDESGARMFDFTTIPNGRDDYTVPNLSNYYYQYLPYYPQFLNYVSEKNKIEQSFKIINKLIEKKIIKVISVEDFIRLVNEISEIL